MTDYKINGSFICERCRNVCKGGCHEHLSAILAGDAIEGTPEYEAWKDLVGRKQIITCLGPYCDEPCEFQKDKFTPYGDSDGIGEMVSLIKYMGSRIHELLRDNQG